MLSALARQADHSVKRYPLIPAVALTVTREELARLAADPDVASIREDMLLYPTLLQSARVVGAAAAVKRGFTGKGQTVAILDSGVDKFHPFLSRIDWVRNAWVSKVVSEACYSTNSTISRSTCPGGAASSTAPDSGYACDLYTPGCSHGTHVAGIAAGTSTNNEVAGARFGMAPDANIIAIQVFSYTGGGIASFLSDVDLALQRIVALRNTFDISSVNLSLGSGRYFSNCDAAFPSTKAAIDLLRSSGIATVIASGNDGWSDSISGPACISSAIAVGSTTKADYISEFSNMSPLVDLVAPGSEIFSSLPHAGPDGATGAASGTSMAAPHVAGAWAAIKQARGDAAVAEVLGWLQETGTPIPDVPGVLGRRINVNRVIDRLAPPHRILTADFNRDGRDDVLRYDPFSGWWSIRLMVPNGPGLVEWTSGRWAADLTIHKADFDGDGWVDLFLHNVADGSWTKLLNNPGTTTFSAVTGGWLPGLVSYMAELNGDGRSDIFLYNAANGTWFKAFGTGTGRGAFSYASGGWRSGWTLHPADFSGDGLTDFFLFDEASGTWFKAISDGAAGFRYHSGGWLTGYRRIVTDFNGDARADILLLNPSDGTWFKCTSTGDGSAGFSYESGGWIAGFEVFTADFDRNRAQDLFLYHPVNGTWFKVLNDGARFRYVGGGWAQWQVVSGDMTGDGRTDFLLFSPASQSWYLAASPMADPAATPFGYTNGAWIWE